MGHIYKFSYDDRNDAIQSLANYYSVESNYLKSQLKDIFLYIQNLKDEGLYYEQMLNGMMQVNIALKLNPSFRNETNDKLRISYYHSCLTDGTKEWFKEGLLNNLEGIKCFINKILELKPEIRSLKLDIDRIIRKSKNKAFDEEQIELDGICGFYRYQDAIHSNYGLPEIFQDAGLYEGLETYLLPVLKLTTVKFYVEREMNECNSIVSKYWEALYLTQDEEGELESGLNVGRGKTIPFENIEWIKDHV